MIAKEFDNNFGTMRLSDTFGIVRLDFIIGNFFI